MPKKQQFIRSEGALHGQISDGFASAAEELTAPVVTELTAAEVAMVAGGLEEQSAAVAR